VRGGLRRIALARLQEAFAGPYRMTLLGGTVPVIEVMAGCLAASTDVARRRASVRVSSELAESIDSPSALASGPCIGENEGPYSGLFHL